MLPAVQSSLPPSSNLSPAPGSLTLRAVAALCLAILRGAHGMAVAQPRNERVGAAQVDRDLFSGFPPPGTSCLPLRAGHSRAQVSASTLLTPTTGMWAARRAPAAPAATTC